MKSTVLLFLFFCSTLALAQKDNPFVLLRQLDESDDELPLMEVVEDTATINLDVQNAIQTSFLNQSIQLYHLAQNFLINTGQQTNREPAYLAITRNQGGFARKGFRLKTANGIIEKKDAFYVDLTEGHITSSLDKLMSLTQIYPHELGHAIYRLLSSNDSTEQEAKSVTVHYFSLLTDNSIAFNEGFAEHLENISRLFETNKQIKGGIEEDVSRIEPKLLRSSKSFLRDFIWPYRLGYYKASMIAWYQQFEDYKRYKHAMEGNVVFKNNYPELSSIADMITIRNTGVYQTTEKRNISQLMASEGFVSTFFTHLAIKGLGRSYFEPDFYRSFLKDTTKADFVPENTFNEVENLFIKYFYVLNKHVKLEVTDKAQLIDFIDGFLEEFPEDAKTVMETYYELTGEDYSSYYPLSHWLMVKNYSHRLLALDAYGAITVPMYTFNINSAEEIDFLTIEGMDKSSAKKIVERRNEVGYFSSFEDLLDMDGISESAMNGLVASDFDEGLLEGIDIEELTIGPLISVPLVSLLKRGSLSFIVIFLISYAVVLRKSVKGFKALLTLIKYYFLWILLILAGLISTLFQSNPILLFLGFAAVYLVIGIIILRQKTTSTNHFILVSFLMMTLVIYSLI